MKAIKITNAFLISALVFCYSCGNNDYEERNEARKNAENEIDNYKEAKLTIEEQESRNPVDFLEADGEYRPALLGGNFLITGFVKNKATSVTYKDVTVEFNYFSKTNSKIGSEKRTFYEFITPGNKYEFRFKVWAPEGTSTLGWEVLSAKNK